MSLASLPSMFKFLCSQQNYATCVRMTFVLAGYSHMSIFPLNKPSYCLYAAISIVRQYFIHQGNAPFDQFWRVLMKPYSKTGKNTCLLLYDDILIGLTVLWNQQKDIVLMLIAPNEKC